MTEGTLRKLLKELKWSLRVNVRENNATYYYAIKEHWKNIYLGTPSGIAAMTEEDVRQKILRNAVKL